MLYPNRIYGKQKPNSFLCYKNLKALVESQFSREDGTSISVESKGTKYEVLMAWDR